VGLNGSIKAIILIFKTSNNGFKYLIELSKVAGVVKVRDILGTELLQLKRGKKKWTGNNVEIRDGLPLLIYSPSSNRYWYRILQADHDLNVLRRYIKDGNLFILFNDEWREKVIAEREKEGKSYADYNRLRSLIILKEILEGQNDRPDIKTKMRAIELEMNKINNKYK